MRATDLHRAALAAHGLRLSDVLAAIAVAAVVIILGALMGVSLFGNP